MSYELDDVGLTHYDELFVNQSGYWNPKLGERGLIRVTAERPPAVETDGRRFVADAAAKADPI